MDWPLLMRPLWWAIMSFSPRKELLPATINAGIDMILFNKNIDEDYAIMTEAVSSGLVSIDRLNQAVTRILATKLSQGLMNEAGQFIGQIPEKPILKLVST